MPTHESEQRRRLSLPSARAAPPASPRPFPQPDPSPQSPSLVTSLCRSELSKCKSSGHIFFAISTAVSSCVSLPSLSASRERSAWNFGTMPLGNYPLTSRRTNGILSVVVNNEPQTNHSAALALYDYGL